MTATPSVDGVRRASRARSDGVKEFAISRASAKYVDAAACSPRASAISPACRKRRASFIPSASARRMARAAPAGSPVTARVHAIASCVKTSARCANSVRANSTAWVAPSPRAFRPRAAVQSGRHYFSLLRSRRGRGQAALCIRAQRPVVCLPRQSRAEGGRISRKPFAVKTNTTPRLRLARIPRVRCDAKIPRVSLIAKPAAAPPPRSRFAQVQRRD